MYLMEGVSYREVHLQGYPNWGRFIERSVSYIEGVSYREEYFLKGGSTVCKILMGIVLPKETATTNF